MTEQPTEERTIRLASVVAIDIVGLSALSEHDQPGAARKIKALREGVEAVAAAYGGRLFNTAGEGLMLEFDSAGAALGAIQDILDRRDKKAPQVRVGAHVGDVIVTATEDLLGPSVNVAARLQQLADPGTARVSVEFRSMAHASPAAAFLFNARKPLDEIERRVRTFEILSQRGKFARTARRLLWGLGLILALGAIAFLGPFLWDSIEPLVAPLLPRS